MTQKVCNGMKIKIVPLLFFALIQHATFCQELKVIEQNFHDALELAIEENKLLLIDFYTDWCVPCKKLDEVVFKNDSVQTKLGNDFILLKYNAEEDSIYHLAKKHHVNSYPTGLILNKEG